MDTNEIWQKILHQLSKRLSEGKVKALLEPLPYDIHPAPADDIDGSGPSGRYVITLTIPGIPFIAARIKQLEPEIIGCAEEVLGSCPILRMVEEQVHPGTHSKTDLQSLALSLPSTSPALLMSERQLELPIPLPRIRVASNGPRINWKYSFDDFVVGPCNQIAHAAASNIITSQASVDMVPSNRHYDYFSIFAHIPISNALHF
ncbi:MAG: hypothetical protein II737_03995 [Mailhella sp.]|nr:hypothetical protein [Mailhella sp.]